ncbi:DUF2510 domain-containing protein [Mycolicibacterium sp. 050158]|uniref:DUF2510 domain-containing protein n=1 Tax=Mycolicibacterium sp. 050158 TaxID=3090602 RepID=UPI00299E5A1B|nr:DUF2510 domain-containing protein [Mycolicibacterium sp. 050158]MDX1888866.1 DUF2510 domain-containing protein [Mycolicibacterium sp. 050158]
MTGPLPKPGWYPDPTGAPRQRYWTGTEWAPLAPPAAQVPPPPPAPKKVMSWEKIILLPLAVVFAGLAVLFAIAGKWEAVGGVLVLGVFVAAPVLLVLLMVRRTRQSRQIRAEQRAYREGLIARADQQHGSFMGGDAGGPGAFGSAPWMQFPPSSDDRPTASG